MSSKITDKLTWFLWVGLVAALPLTSMPLVSRITRSSSVAPGSLLFLIPLVLVLLPVYFRKGRLPFQTIPALFFFGYAFLTIALAFLVEVPYYKDQKLLTAAVDGAATLGLGLLFLLVSLAVPNTNKKIEKTLRVLNWTGLVMIIWSVFGVFHKHYMPDLKPFINEVQGLFSLNRLYKERMIGFAAEPSWLAHQLNLVFLAYWMAATLTRSSVHKFRIWFFTLENLLLIAGIAVLLGTLSRGGIGAFLLVIGFLFLLLNIRFIRWLTHKWRGKRKTWLTILATLGMIFVYVGILAGSLFLLSKVDPRMEGVFRFSTEEENPILSYADSLQFGERVIYWQTGWNIFNAHPYTGVGVGFSGFYFPQYLPDTGFGLAESRELLYRTEGLLNVKNFWSRLLAETGIVGFSLFVTFLITCLIPAIDMIRAKPGLRKALGYMCLLMLIALVIESFSVDSFALPYMWFTLGLCAAGWRWYHPI